MNCTLNRSIKKIKILCLYKDSKNLCLLQNACRSSK